MSISQAPVVTYVLNGGVLSTDPTQGDYPSTKSLERLRGLASKVSCCVNPCFARPALTAITLCGEANAKRNHQGAMKAYRKAKYLLCASYLLGTISLLAAVSLCSLVIMYILAGLPSIVQV